MANIKLSNKILSKVFFACFAVFLLVPFGAKLEAATMSLVSSSLSVDVGGIFTLKAFVDTQQKYINNAEATISFSPDLVEVVSVSGKDSIFSLWVEQPTFSNINGQITFNGGVVNPGLLVQGAKRYRLSLGQKNQARQTFCFQEWLFGKMTDWVPIF